MTTTRQLRDVPIGTGATGTHAESDSMGSIEVPAEPSSLPKAGHSVPGLFQVGREGGGSPALVAGGVTLVGDKATDCV